MRSSKIAVAGGRPYPLGATWDGQGANFALFSANAERVDLCLFERSGRRDTVEIADVRRQRPLPATSLRGNRL